MGQERMGPRAMAPSAHKKCFPGAAGQVSVFQGVRREVAAGRPLSQGTATAAPSAAVVTCAFLGLTETQRVGLGRGPGAGQGELPHLGYTLHVRSHKVTLNTKSKPDRTQLAVRVARAWGQRAGWAGAQPVSPCGTGRAV